MSKKFISLFYKAVTNSYAKIPVVRFVIVSMTEKTPSVQLAKQPSASLSRFAFCSDSRFGADDMVLVKLASPIYLGC